MMLFLVKESKIEGKLSNDTAMRHGIVPIRLGANRNCSDCYIATALVFQHCILPAKKHTHSLAMLSHAVLVINPTLP